MIVDISVSNKCINHDSYGVICVGCNMCGRFDRKTMWNDRYAHYIEELKELTEKLTDDFYQSELQQENIASDIVYIGKKLKVCISHLEFGEDELHE